MIRRAGGGGRPRRRRGGQHLRGDRPRRCGRRARRSARLRRERPDARIVVTGCAAQTEPATLRATCPRSIACSAMSEKLAEFWRDTRRCSARRRRRREEKIAVGDIMAVTRDGAASDRRHRGPHPRFRAGAERLRPPLHLLHHSVRPRQFALGADGRGGGAGAPPGRARLSRDGADRRRYHQLRAGLPGRRGSARW